jgi:dTMP kinase
LFIVFEGLDRSGKSSQAALLAEKLKEAGRAVKLMRFPARDSGPIGKMIDEYLRSGNNLSDEAIHLLFSANRWEVAESIKRDLQNGFDIICDRYLYSGVVYSASKGLPWEWCAAPDRLLPKPDMVLFLNVDPKVAESRGAFGQERYEKVEFQAKVRENFYRFKVTEGDYWKEVNANNTFDEVTAEIRAKVDSLLKETSEAEKPIEPIWADKYLGC